VISALLAAVALRNYCTLCGGRKSQNISYASTAKRCERYCVLIHSVVIIYDACLYMQEAHLCHTQRTVYCMLKFFFVCLSVYEYIYIYTLHRFAFTVLWEMTPAGEILKVIPIQ
jgi:hypothetical protein